MLPPSTSQPRLVNTPLGPSDAHTCDDVDGGVDFVQLFHGLGDGDEEVVGRVGLQQLHRGGEKRVACIAIGNDIPHPLQAVGSARCRPWSRRGRVEWVGGRRDSKMKKNNLLPESTLEATQGQILSQSPKYAT